MEAHAPTATDELLIGHAGDLQNLSLPELNSRYTTASNQLALLQSQLSSDVDLISQKLDVSNIGGAINTRAGVSRIPTEIRGTILAYLREDWPPFLVRAQGATQGSDAVVESEGVSKLTLDLAWIKVTHTSRLWRDAGLAFGDIWAGIDTHLVGLKWSAEMIARSRGAPLTLTHRYAPDSHNGHQFLAGGIPQTKSLEVDAFRADGSMLELLQKCAAPNLEELFLQSRSTIYIDENDVGYANFSTLPEVLFNSSTSRLRVLVLDSVIPSWTSPLFSTANISYLSVSFDNPYPGSLDVLQKIIDMPPADLLSALSSLGPSLEVLILVNCLPLIEKWKKMQHRGPVSLPSLRRIDITCDSLEVLFGFTGYLTVTGTVHRLDFEVDSLDDSSIAQSDIWIQGMYTRLLGLIRSFCFATPSLNARGPQNLRAFDSLSIELTPDPRVVTEDDEDEEDPDGIQPFLTLELKSGSQSSPTSSPPQQQPPRIHVSMPLDLPMTGPMVTLRLLEMLPAPWTQLKSLHIANSVADSDGNPFRGLWTDEHVNELVARLGGALSELETLNSGSGFSESITDLLRLSDPAAVFPKLSAITMEDDSELYLKDNFELWMSDPRPHWPRAGSNSSGLSDLFGALYHVLMVREARGSKISRLRLTPWISTEMVLPDDGEDVEMGTGLTEEWKDAFRELEREIEPLVGTVKISFTSPREEESSRMQELYTSMLPI
ncbi:uncharacterized protein STEHIDRAFT_109670 [Stereum hirsutum FP-91666 SS1]|uniref:uncharacterized protein n=1 Tax=Stereum hirsutum (strain FP-91666) TaxID=721885 RepID=UPI000440F1FF|nr:uncharacterized protein STEHIDRAFT_109670 [Stereum hirsutum FP-91666 SS1]EIM87789.1 hypothetical protein STEHIDRAFT_109670 [Stereum hirsutum FP-91666 SS1]